MVIKLISIGKTKDKVYVNLQQEYLKKLKHYGKVECIELPALKGSGKISQEEQKRAEGKVILSHVKPGSKLVLLDENGQHFSSPKFAKKIENWQISSTAEVNLIIGGPFGFSEEVYDRAHEKIALSSMTFTHQMVRLFILEQLYRAFTIIKGEKYHH